MNKEEIIQRLKTIIRNAGKSSIVDKIDVENIVNEYENTNDFGYTPEEVNEIEEDVEDSENNTKELDN